MTVTINYVPGPMTSFTASEASPGIIRAPGSTPATVRKLHSYFVAHKESIVVFGNALFGSLATVKFLSRAAMRSLRRLEAMITYDKTVTDST